MQSSKLCVAVAMLVVVGGLVAAADVGSSSSSPPSAPDEGYASMPRIRLYGKRSYSASKAAPKHFADLDKFRSMAPSSMSVSTETVSKPTSIDDIARRRMDQGVTSRLAFGPLASGPHVSQLSPSDHGSLDRQKLHLSALLQPSLLGTTVHVSDSEHDEHAPPLVVRGPRGPISISPTSVARKSKRSPWSPHEASVTVIDEATPFVNMMREIFEQMLPLAREFFSEKSKTAQAAPPNVIEESEAEPAATASPSPSPTKPRWHSIPMFVKLRDDYNTVYPANDVGHVLHDRPEENEINDQVYDSKPKTSIAWKPKVSEWSSIDTTHYPPASESAFDNHDSLSSETETKPVVASILGPGADKVAQEFDAKHVSEVAKKPVPFSIEAGKKALNEFQSIITMLKMMKGQNHTQAGANKVFTTTTATTVPTITTVDDHKFTDPLAMFDSNMIDSRANNTTKTSYLQLFLNGKVGKSQPTLVSMTQKPSNSNKSTKLTLEEYIQKLKDDQDQFESKKVVTTKSPPSKANWTVVDVRNFFATRAASVNNLTRGYGSPKLNLFKLDDKMKTEETQGIPSFVSLFKGGGGVRNKHSNLSAFYDDKLIDEIKSKLRPTWSHAAVAAAAAGHKNTIDMFSFQRPIALSGHKDKFLPIGHKDKITATGHKDKLIAPYLRIPGSIIAHNNSFAFNSSAFDDSKPKRKPLTFSDIFRSAMNNSTTRTKPLVGHKNKIGKNGSDTYTFYKNGYVFTFKRLYSIVSPPKDNLTEGFPKFPVSEKKLRDAPKIEDIFKKLSDAPKIEDIVKKPSDAPKIEDIFKKHSDAPKIEDIVKKPSKLSLTSNSTKNELNKFAHYPPYFLSLLDNVHGEDSKTTAPTMPKLAHFQLDTNKLLAEWTRHAQKQAAAKKRNSTLVAKDNNDDHDDDEVTNNVWGLGDKAKVNTKKQTLPPSIVAYMKKTRMSKEKAAEREEGWSPKKSATTATIFELVNPRLAKEKKKTSKFETPEERAEAKCLVMGKQDEVTYHVNIESGCQTYIVCDGLHGQEYNCLATKIFDTGLKRCEWVWRAQCG